MASVSRPTVARITHPPLNNFDSVVAGKLGEMNGGGEPIITITVVFVLLAPPSFSAPSFPCVCVVNLLLLLHTVHFVMLRVK